MPPVAPAVSVAVCPPGRPCFVVVTLADNGMPVVTCTEAEHVVPAASVAVQLARYVPAVAGAVNVGLATFEALKTVAVTSAPLGLSTVQA